MELTKDEKQSLIHLLDLANKAGGLNVASACLHFVEKFELVEKPTKKEEVKEEPKK